MKMLNTVDAPVADDPYSQAVVSGHFLFVSAQLPIEPSTGEFSSTDPGGQMRQCLANITAIAKAAGTDIARTVKTPALVTHLSVFAELNADYA